MGPPPVAVPQTSVFYANDDTVIGQSNEMQKRYNVSLNEISPYVKRGNTFYRRSKILQTSWL